MEGQFSEDFKKKFIFMFTRELVLNSEKKDILKLQNIVEEKKKENAQQKEIPKIQFIPQPSPVKEISRPVRMKMPKRLEKPIQQTKPIVRQMPMPQHIIQRPNRLLFIPEPTLPKHLEYLKPIASTGDKFEIDLGKLNPLLRDPAVKVIEASPDERVRVMGTMGTRMTDIFLTKDEVDIIIQKFSDASKIPTMEGIYRVAVGNLVLSAIISDVTGSRFVIKKIPPTPQKTPETNKPEQEIIPRKY